MTATITPAPPTPTTHPFRWACPACRADLDAVAERARCAACGGVYARRDGIWRFLGADDAARAAVFAREYGAVRQAEGWRRDDERWLCGLPDVPDDDPQAALWRRRAGSFRLLIARVIAPLERACGRALMVLDLGAGNGWLAHRLARRGHHIAAVDLLDDDWDGLGAHRRYDCDRIAPVQATFDRLPVADGAIDLVVFNASLHYSADYAATLAEALRVLRPDGQLAILDSPLYADPASGARMVRERADAYRRRHGFPSDALGGVGYLTDAGLRDLGAELGLRWSSPGQPARWRRTLDRWRGRRSLGREAATMPLIVGTLRASSVATPNSVATPRGRVCDPPLPTMLYGRRIAARGPDRRRVPTAVGGRSWAAPLRPGTRLRVIQSPIHPAQPTTPPRLNRLRRAVARRADRWRFLLFQRHRYNRLTIERVHGTPLIVLPQVFNPALFRSSALLVGALAGQSLGPGAAVLDLGTGSGVGAVFAARLGARVVATDINPAAVRCARLNAALHGLDDRIDARGGDLFAPVAGERFDLVLFNPPFFRGTPRDALDHAWRSEDAVERFAAALRDHLTPTGRALVVLSTDGDTPAFLRAFAAHGFAIAVVAERAYGSEIVTVYEMSELSDRGSERTAH